MSSTKEVLDIFILGQLIHGNKTLDDLVTTLSDVYNHFDNGATAEERLKIDERVILSKKLLGNLKVLENDNVITSSVILLITNIDIPDQEKPDQYSGLVTIYRLVPVTDF